MVSMHQDTIHIATRWLRDKRDSHTGGRLLRESLRGHALKESIEHLRVLTAICLIWNSVSIAHINIDFFFLNECFQLKGGE